jgi:hypothetical protein
MEHTATGATVAEAVRAAINESVGSLRAAATEAGIPLTTLHRKLIGSGDGFTVAELRRLATATGKRPSDFGVDGE